MNLTPTQIRQLSSLFALCDEAIGDDTIHLKFVSYWESLRADLGLAALLLLVKEYIRTGGG